MMDDEEEKIWILNWLIEFIGKALLALINNANAKSSLSPNSKSFSYLWFFMGKALLVVINNANA